MKIIGSVKEDLSKEKRVSITPETVKRLKDLDFSVFLEKTYGEHLGIADEEYKNKGANLHSSAKEILEKSEIILKVNCPSNDEISFIKDKSILIGQFNLFSNEENLNKLINKNVKIFSLNLLPRITRAQSMDVLSSQANLAGYRAVIESVGEFGKAIPMMMTAAGTITPAKILVIGAGVAGLQAIATAKRLGGIVSATDVRTVAKEQVESLGGKFLSVEGAENLETAAGYAKETGEDFKRKQAELLINSVKTNDIIIPDASANLIWSMQGLKIFKKQKIFTALNHSPMGYSVAASIGAQLARKNSNVIAIIGDGSMPMNIQELQTIKNFNIPVKVFIMNNSGYGLIKQTQETWLKGNYVGVDAKSGLGLPDFKKVAKSYGLETSKIQNSNNLKKQIKKITFFNFINQARFNLLSLSAYNYHSKINSK